MCTLIVFRHIDARFPLVIAANRDERPTRPTREPAELAGGIYAPIDLVRGGSWIGVNDRGLTASLTNRFIAPRRHGRRSRGLLVTEALNALNTADAAGAVLLQPNGAYNGFQLFLDDGRDAALIWSNGGGYYAERLDQGAWAFTGDDDRPGRSERAEAVSRWLRSGLHLDDWDWLQRLLTFHGDGPENGTCVHGPGVSMESVLSMVIRRPAGPNAWQIAWRAGRPCQNGVWHRVDRPVIQP